MGEVLALPGVKAMFAVGLSWRHEDVAPKGKALRQLARQYGQWGTVFTAHGGGVQVGFCDPLRNVKNPTSLKALAATIANQYPQPWRGVFKLREDRYWYIAVRDGQEILPDGDRIGTLAEIQSTLAEHDRHGNWTNYEKSLPELAEIVQRHSKFHKLKDLGFDPTLRYSGIAAAVALLWIAAGAGLYLQNKHQQDAIAARQVAIRAKGAAEHAASQAKANLHIWENLPRAEEILSACNEQWAKLDFGKHGWVLSNWNCSADTTGITIETEWDRLGGLAKYAPGQLKSDGNHSADSHSVPIAWQSFSGDAESDAQSDRDIWTLAQLYGLGLKLEQDTGAVKIVDPEGKQIPRPWSQTGANFSLIAPPWFVPGTKAFDKVAGLRLTRINFDTHSQSWGVVATLYSMHELRPVPVEHDTTVKSLPVGRAEVPLALAISVQSPVKQSLVSEAGSSAIAQPQSRVNFDTRPSSASEIARPTVSVATDNGTAEEADGTTTVLPLSNSLTQSASAVSPASNVSIGMGALALAQQAQRAKHFQASQPATKTQSGAQALTPPGLGD